MSEPNLEGRGGVRQAWQGGESQKGEQQREMRTDTDGRRAGRDVRVALPGVGQLLRLAGWASIVRVARGFGSSLSRREVI